MNKRHFIVTIRTEWSGAEVSLMHFADVAALEDTWSKDCIHQHRDEWRTTCTRDAGPKLSRDELRVVITRNSDLVCAGRLCLVWYGTMHQFTMWL